MNNEPACQSIARHHAMARKRVPWHQTEAGYATVSLGPVRQGCSRMSNELGNLLSGAWGK